MRAEQNFGILAWVIAADHQDVRGRLWRDTLQPGRQGDAGDA